MFGRREARFQRQIAENVLRWFKENAQIIDSVYRSTHYSNHSKSKPRTFEPAFTFCERGHEK